MKIDVVLILTADLALMLLVYAFASDQRILKASFPQLSFPKSLNFLKKELIDFEIYTEQALFGKKSLLLPLESHLPGD
jgi:hypothetical protein